MMRAENNSIRKAFSNRLPPQTKYQVFPFKVNPVFIRSFKLTAFVSLKAHWQIPKKWYFEIVHVIKHANFQLYRVHPDGVI